MRFFPAFALGSLVSLMVATFVGTATDEAIDNDDARRNGAAYSSIRQLQRLRQDADQGSRLAQYLLGIMYQLGEIVPQDVRRAAEQWPWSLRSWFSVRCMLCRLL
jgi:TPR repeat protein